MVEQDALKMFKQGRIVTLFGKIEFENVEKVLKEIVNLWRKKPEEEVFLIINSGGGSIDAGFTFTDFVQSIDVKLVTVGSGNVNSMAIPVFCAGQRRLVTKHTKFFFHEVGYSADEKQRQSVSQIRTRGKNLLISQEWYADFVSKQTDNKLTPKAVLSLMKNETWVFPEGLIKQGLAHKII